ncbi:MAG: riboflavin synthase, partial [Tolumonas sp.]|nr:riboflavin synthase [Tolumonas sp.]
HYQAGQKVNLERALTPDTRLGGHLVSGHVDGVGEIVSVHQLGRAKEYWIKAPDELAKYIAEKGSITVDGISLTVNAVDGARFKLTIVPHTSAETTVLDWQTGVKVNLEVDVIARYLERLLLGDKAAQSSQSNITMEMLARNGFLR